MKYWMKLHNLDEGSGKTWMENMKHRDMQALHFLKYEKFIHDVSLESVVQIPFVFKNK